MVARVEPAAVIAADVATGRRELGALDGGFLDEVGRRVRVGGRVAFLDLDLDVAFKLGDFLVGVD